jgi:SAM-dependent methyltransferase
VYAADLARVHHEGFAFAAESAAPVLLAALHDAGLSAGTVTDLGCGSGILSRIVFEAGYGVFGVDYSEDMLQFARKNVPGGEFVRGSVLDAPLPTSVAIAAVGEIFCYAFDERAGLDAFTRMMKTIHEALVPGGVFLFDVAGPGRVGPTPRTNMVDNENWTIVHRATESGTTLTREIATFMRDGDRYRRSDERHVQRLYRPEEILAALAAAGFHAAALTGYGAFTLPTGWHAFLARK